ncbi:MAG TPA: fibronectin type III domain-containing protein [Terriglobales bacterium]|nr:fibronectin type III domain-containing protein [Terriglobales bacterium]
MNRLSAFPAAGLLLLCAACAVPGAPQPPSLELPRPVRDLEARRKGDRVLLAWTPPAETTDATRIARPGVTRVCRLPDAQATTCAPAGELVAGRWAGVPRAEFTDRIPPEEQSANPAGFRYYAVETLNDRGQSAGLSNRVQVPLAPTLEPPSDLRAALSAEGITLTWTGRIHQHAEPQMRHRYRLYRRSPGGPDAVIAEFLLTTAPEARIVDRAFDWEKTYQYRVAVVTVFPRDGEAPIEVEGEDSAAVEVVAHDTFPPAAPTGLQAVSSASGAERFVDLIWTANTEADLAGYHVYRRDPTPPHRRAAGTGDPGEFLPPRRITSELVKAPAFRDSQVEPGKRYLYSVTAVDVRGNESPPSAEASETVPE